MIKAGKNIYNYFNIKSCDNLFVIIRVQSWTSDKQRAIETGKSFLQGLELDSEDIVVDNSKATYYKDEYGCEKYVNEVNDNIFE